jgi:hypothetical protein
VPGPGGIQAPGGSGAQGCELRFWLTRLRRNLRKNVPLGATHEKVGRHGTWCFATAPQRTHSTRTCPFAIWSCKNWIVAFSNASCTKSPIASAVGGAVSLQA